VSGPQFRRRPVSTVEGPVNPPWVKSFAAMLSIPDCSTSPVRITPLTVVSTILNIPSPLFPVVPVTGADPITLRVTGFCECLQVSIFPSSPVVVFFSLALSRKTSLLTGTRWVSRGLSASAPPTRLYYIISCALGVTFGKAFRTGELLDFFGSSSVNVFFANRFFAPPVTFRGSCSLEMRSLSPPGQG